MNESIGNWRGGLEYWVILVNNKYAHKVALNKSNHLTSKKSNFDFDYKSQTMDTFLMDPHSCLIICIQF